MLYILQLLLHMESHQHFVASGTVLPFSHYALLHLKVMTVRSVFVMLDNAAQGYECTCIDLGHEPCWDLPCPMERRRLCAHDETCMMVRQSCWYRFGWLI